MSNPDAVKAELDALRKLNITNSNAKALDEKGGVALNMADWQADQRALKEADRQSKQQATATLQSFQNTYVAKSTLSALQKEGREKQRMAQEQNHNYRASFTGTAGTAAGGGGGSNKTKIEREVQQADVVMGDSREDVFMPTTGIKVSDVVANLNHHQPSEEEIAMDPPVPPPIVKVAEDVASGISVSGAVANLKLQPKEEEIAMDPVAPPTIVKVAPTTADVVMGDSREDVATGINVSSSVANLDHQPKEEEEEEEIVMMDPPAPPPIVKVDPTTRADVAMRDSREDVTTGINVSGAVTNFNLQPKEEEEEEIVLDPPAAPTVVKVARTPPPTVVAPTTGINVSDVVTNIGEDEIEAEGMVMVENPHRDSDEWVSVPPPDDPFSLSTVKHSNVSAAAATTTVVAPTLTNVDFTFAVLSFEQPPHVEKYLRAAAFIVGVEDATLKSMQQQASTGDRPWVHKYLVTATLRVCFIGHSHVEAKQHVLGLLKTAVQDGSFFSIASSPPPDDKE